MLLTRFRDSAIRHSASAPILPIYIVSRLRLDSRSIQIAVKLEMKAGIKLAVQKLKFPKIARTMQVYAVQVAVDTERKAVDRMIPKVVFFSSSILRMRPRTKSESLKSEVIKIVFTLNSRYYHIDDRVCSEAVNCRDD